MSPVQIISPIKGGRAGAVAQVLHVQLPEEAQLETVYSAAQLAELVKALGGEGRGSWAVVAGEDAGALATAPDFEDSTASAERQASEITDWLSQHSSNKVETLVIGAIVAPPKSWALAAMGDQELQRRLQAAMGSAAQAYMDAMRCHAQVRIHDRSAPAKKEQERKEQPQALRGWAAAHTISGAGDPHLHLHVLTATRAQGSSGKWGHLWQPTVLKQAGRIAEGAAMHVLRQAVTDSGYALDEAGEIVGIGHDRRLIETASRAQTGVTMIRAALAGVGIPVGPNAAWEMWRQLRSGKPVRGLPDDVAQQIRELVGTGQNSEALERSLDEALTSDVRRAALVAHWSQIYNRDLVELANEAKEQAQRAPVIAPADQVVSWMSSYRTSATDSQMLAWCVEAVGPEAAEALMDQLREDPRVVVGRNKWATIERAIREDQIVERVEALVPHVEMTALEALARTDVTLAVMSGVAGAGKSALLVPASRAWRGRTVWATARNRFLADQIGRTLGCRSTSLEALRQQIAQGCGPGAGDVVIVDEIALLNHVDVELVLGLAEAGCVVKGLGDELQLAPIDGSTSSRLLVETARGAGQPWLEVSRRCETWRDVHDALRQAIEDIHDDAPLDQLIAGLHIVPISKPEDAIALNRDAELVVATNAVRTRLAEALSRPNDPDDERLVARGRDDTAIWAGDRIVCRDNLWQRGHMLLANGEMGHLVLVGPKSVVVQRDRDGEEIALSRHDVEDKIALGGAWTADSAQGQTFKQVTVVLTGIDTGEGLYSAATRSQELPIIAVVVPDAVPPERRQEAAEDAVLRTLERSRRTGTVREMARVWLRWSDGSGGFRDDPVCVT